MRRCTPLSALRTLHFCGDRTENGTKKRGTKEMDGFVISDVLVAMQAMQRRELKVFYQPKVDATTSRMKSAEALIRWVKEDGSVILPNQFLPAMEQTGAIAMLDWYVVESVCAFLERLKNLNI